MYNDDDWSSNGVGSSHLDTTFSFTVSVSLDVDESLISPSVSPRVLDFVVLLSAEASVSDGKDSVVKVGSAVSCVDSALVELEGKVVSLDGNWNGGLGNCSQQAVLFINGDLSAVTDGPGLISSSVFAGWSNSLVWVLALSGNSVILDVEEGKVHQTTSATIVSIWVGAVNELLLGEGLEGVFGKEVSTLNRTSCWESPAWSALSLVFNGSDGTFGSPINLVGQASSGSLLSSAISGGTVFWEANEVFSSELSRVEISELVHLNVVSLKSSLVSFVVGLDEGDIVEPNSQSICLLLGSVPLVVFGLPGVEGVVLEVLVGVIVGVERDCSYCQDGQKQNFCLSHGKNYYQINPTDLN